MMQNYHDEHALQCHVIDDHQMLLRNENEKIHLAFLYASPLMLKTSDKKYYDVLPPISFSEEFQQIKNCFDSKQVALNYRYSVGTARNLLTALRENPVGLHFSGHGFQNNQKLF